VVTGRCDARAPWPPTGQNGAEAEKLSKPCAASWAPKLTSSRPKAGGQKNEEVRHTGQTSSGELRNELLRERFLPTGPSKDPCSGSMMSRFGYPVRLRKVTSFPRKSAD